MITHLSRYRKAEPHSEEETALLQQIVAEEAAAEEALYDLLASEEEVMAYNAARWEPVLQQVLAIDKAILEEGHKVTSKLYLLRKWRWVAAAVLLVVATSTYFWSHNKQQPLISNNKHLQTDILPGKEGAVLTLADGSEMVLDGLSDGLIADQNGSQVHLKNGQIAYDATGNTTAEMEYNTMSTPNGRQFQITLSDGTQVWLNAASSIRYPTAFAGNERNVFITGEAYFQVAKNAKKPFRVNINNKAEVEVLGTSFNINAYDNEKTLNTTLLEGSVKVNGKIIKPGQQALLSVTAVSVDHPLPSADQVEIINVKVSAVMAWKNGFINFDGETLDAIMRQLERWYDIKVVYEKEIPTIRFFGNMSRGVSLAGVLKALQEAGVRFRMEEGRRLVVLP